MSGIIIADSGINYKIYNIVRNKKLNVVKFSLDINGEMVECRSPLKPNGLIERRYTTYNYRVLNVVDGVLKGCIDEDTDEVRIFVNDVLDTFGRLF